MLCDALPREALAHFPTPLEAAPRLGAALGIDLYIKREDLAGLAAGGNKTRLMEFALGALRRDGIDTLIASAAAQSNKLREIAAGAARCGLHACLLIPPDAEGHPPQGNRLLFDLLGAEVRELPADLDDAGVLAAQEAVCAEFTRAGRRPAVLDRRLDYGLSATAAYVSAAEELLAQCETLHIDPAHVFITVGAGMTAAGLALGLKARGARARVTGICVARSAAELMSDVLAYAARTAAHLRIATRLAGTDLTLSDRHLAPGYGVVTPALRAAVQLVARTHGLVLDPVYNGKTAMALIAMAGDGSLAPGSTVVLVNTGGSPAIFAHNLNLADG